MGGVSPEGRSPEKFLQHIHGPAVLELECRTGSLVKKTSPCGFRCLFPANTLQITILNISIMPGSCLQSINGFRWPSKLNPNCLVGNTASPWPKPRLSYLPLFLVSSAFTSLLGSLILTSVPKSCYTQEGTPNLA